MKKILFLFLVFCSFVVFVVGELNMDEVNKYVSEKLNRDKEIIIIYKFNKVNNILEGYSEEGKFIVVNFLKDELDIV